MSAPNPVREYVEYRVNDEQVRRLCEPEPVIYVNVYRRTKAVEYRPDGSTVTTEDREQLVQSWTYQHTEES